METRAELKRIATERIQAAGIAGATFRDLGAAIGIKSSSVMYHFGSKDALLEELIRDYAGAAFESLRRRTERVRTPRARLGCAVDEFESVLKGERACLCGVLAGEVEQLSEPARRELQNFFQQFQNWLEECFLEIEPTKKEARDKAALMLAALQGGLLIDRTMDAGPRRLSALRRQFTQN